MIPLHAFIARTNEFTALSQLLHPVGAPTGDPGHGKQRRIELHGQSQHLIDEAAVKINVRGDGVLMAPLHHHFEKKGWSEVKVVIRFWIISAALAAIGFCLYFAQSLMG